MSVDTRAMLTVSGDSLQAYAPVNNIAAGNILADMFKEVSDLRAVAQQAMKSRMAAQEAGTVSGPNVTALSLQGKSGSKGIG